MSRRALPALLALCALYLLPAQVDASGTVGNQQNPSPVPQSSVDANIQLNTLIAGAGGTYLPAATQQYVPPRESETNYPGPGYTGPDPEGKPCPSIAATQGNTTGALLIFPTFTRNASGGYDGSEADYGYWQPAAIPAGGNPADDAIGEPATEVTVPGHVIGVLAHVTSYGVWHDATTGIAPYGGSCVGESLTFGTPFLANDAPPPPPSRTVVVTPPFGSAAALMTEVAGTWRIGTVQTMPGPQPTATTYVHIPTCAWLDSTVPSAPVVMHAIKAVSEDDLTLYLVYNLSITPGPVTWWWGDGTTSQSGPVDAGPATLPQYDVATQSWSDPCSVSHAYPAVSDGVTLTASETISVSVTVSWSDGVSVHTASVPCDAVTGGACELPIGPGAGWSSGPHPVAQIEPVPYLPAPSPAG